jgi:AcrR family transcriptional regulator
MMEPGLSFGRIRSSRSRYANVVAMPSDANRQRRRRSDAAENERRVRESARAVFVRRGHAMTVDDVATEAGVARGTVYQTYPSRDVLVSDTVVRFLQDSEAHYREVIARLPAWEALNEIILTPTIGVAATAEVLHPNYPSGPVKDALDRLFSIVDSLLERGRAEGTIRADVTLDHLKLLFRGLYLALPEYSLERAAIAQEHGRFILRGFRASCNRS